jgi:hypothetical protein
MTILAIALVVPGVVLAGAVIWRWAKWPCPAWLVPLLANPYFETVAGAALLLGRAGVGPGMRVLEINSTRPAR